MYDIVSISGMSDVMKKTNIYIYYMRINGIECRVGETRRRAMIIYAEGEERTRQNKAERIIC